MGISYICFEVSAICNMDCKFCFANWRNNKKQLPLKKVLHIIKNLKDNGLEAINLTGGEPLIRKDIIEICQYCKSIGLMTIISTNGINLMNKKEILNYIDAINLPLDSSKKEIHNELRPCSIDNHHGLIIELIKYINSNYPNIKIKINTMVSKPNINDVINIGELIKGKVYSWKLGKFLNSGYGSNFAKSFSITKKDFENTVTMCKKKYASCNIIDQEYKVNEKELFSAFIDSFGNLNIHTDSGIENVGSINNLSNILKRYKQEAFRKKYLLKVYDKESE